MKRTTPARAWTFGLLIAMATLSLSLTAPATPKGAQRDSDPNNLNNWEVLTTEQEGEDYAHRYEYNQGGGYSLVTYYRDWDVMQWYRNGVAFGPPYGQGPDLPIPLPTVVNEAPAVDWTSEGTITVTIRWIGQGSPPATVWLAVTGPIETLIADGGYATGDDGFGSAMEHETWSTGHRYYIDDAVVEEFNVDQYTGYCQIVAVKSAHAESSVSDGWAFADAKILDVQLSSSPEPRPTFQATAAKTLGSLFSNVGRLAFRI